MAAALAANSLEFHIYVDPVGAAEESGASGSQPLARHEQRCLAALLAIRGRLEPRLAACLWQREPFRLSLWEPALSSTTVRDARHQSNAAAEPHLWGRLSFGDSIDDAWFVIDLLLQLSREQRDVAITARDDEGELLLIEAALVIPRWLNPESAHNRVFIRRGAVHLIRKQKGAAAYPLELADALVLVRAGGRSVEAHGPITDAIRARVDTIGNSLAHHTAHCLLPLPAAQVLAGEPQLVSAAVAAFLERGGSATPLHAPDPSHRRHMRPIPTLRIRPTEGAAERFHRARSFRV